MSSFFTTPASQRKRKRPETDQARSRPTKTRALSSANTNTSTRPRTNGNHVPRSRPGTSDKRKTTSNDDDDDISESDADLSDASRSISPIPDDDASSATSSESENETAAEKRLRLAQRYLDKLKSNVDESGFDAQDLDRDIIASRLREDVDEAKGRQFRLLAEKLDWKSCEVIRFRSGNCKSVTGVAVCKPFIYVVGKDGVLSKWETQPKLEEGMRIQSGRVKGGVKRQPVQRGYVRGIRLTINAMGGKGSQHGHTKEILSVAASPDGKYVATGGADRKIIIWSAANLRPLKTFYTHRDSVAGLDFAPSAANASSGFGTQLFSASMDRSIKTYSLAGEDSLAYVETLFGHQDHVLGVVAMGQDQCVSVGARDRSARLWRVVDETQLKFLGDSARNDTYHAGSLDCCAALPPNHFVTGNDAGGISLWSQHKKKALFTVHTAHGVDEVPPLADVTSESDPKVIAQLEKSDRRRPIPRPITALASVPGTDIVLSGSWDGCIRAWKMSDDKRTLLALGSLEQSNVYTDGNDSGISMDGELDQAIKSTPPQSALVKGYVNSIAVFERRKAITSEYGGQKEGDCEGLCIVVGVGKEPRLSRGRRVEQARNNCVILEVPLLAKQRTVSSTV